MLSRSKIILVVALTFLSLPALSSSKTIAKKHSDLVGGVFVMATTVVNVRFGTNQQANVIDKAMKDEVMLVEDSSAGNYPYVKVLRENGEHGWVHKDYLAVWEPDSVKHLIVERG